jgi:hypothetical protein
MWHSAAIRARVSANTAARIISPVTSAADASDKKRGLTVQDMSGTTSQPCSWLSRTQRIFTMYDYKTRPQFVTVNPFYVEGIACAETGVSNCLPPAALAP